MNARTEVPEWCRTDVEDAISDAVVRWALRHLDHIAGQTDHDAVHDPLRILRMAISGNRRTVARNVIVALQGVGVPFSGATGAGAEHETTDDAARTIPDPCARPGCGYGYPWGEPDRCPEHWGMANP